MTVEHRMTSLERSNRFWRALAFGCLVFAAIVFLLGAASDTQTINAAGEFRLLDAQGNVRAKLGLDEIGGPALSLLDRQGRIRAHFALSEAPLTGPGDDGVATSLWLSGANATPAIQLGAASNVRMLALNDLQGTTRARLKVGQYGAIPLTQTTFDLVDPDGQARLTLAASPLSTSRPVNRQTSTPSAPPMMKTSPYLALTDHSGNLRAQLRLWGDGRPSFDLWDIDNRPILNVPRTDEANTPRDP